jgi:hypothetical protein
MSDRPAAAPSIHDTRPWRWIVHDNTLDLYADHSRAVPQSDPDGRLLTISCGAALHHAMVALAASGRAASVDLVSRDGDTGNRRAFAWGDDGFRGSWGQTGIGPLPSAHHQVACVYVTQPIG